MKRAASIAVVLSVIVALIVVPATTALAATTTPVSNDNAGALALGNAIVADAAALAGASFAENPGSGTPDGVIDSAAGFPTDGSNFAAITNGDVTFATKPNLAGNTSTDLGGPATRGDSAYDITVLRLDLAVPAAVNCLRLDFAFYSEEYPEFVGNKFNDGFIAELDSSTWSTSAGAISAPNNFAFDSTGAVVSVNSTGATGMSEENAAGTTYDGGTAHLEADSVITTGAHSVFLSVFDQHDRRYDSAAFIDNLRFTQVADPATDCRPGAHPQTSPAPTSVSAGGPYNVSEGSAVQLQASSPSDPLTYTWDLDNDGTFETSGASPSYQGIDGPSSHVVTAKGCNDGGCATGSTTVSVQDVSPTASASSNTTTTTVNTPVQLSGTWTDPAGSADNVYAWTWTVPGSNTAGSAPYGTTVNRTASFASPGTYTVTFSVTDKDEATGSSSVTITVTSGTQSNQPPVCTNARPSQSTIWPPNHKFVPINIQGVTDPNGDQISITITSIYMDEPVAKMKKKGDDEDNSDHRDHGYHGACAGRMGGDAHVHESSSNGRDDGRDDDDDEDGNSKYSPADAYGIGTSTAYVRAERSGKGDGRVYHIRFTARDGNGGVCTGEVLVAVPHDQNHGAIDGGALYDATKAIGKAPDREHDRDSARTYHAPSKKARARHR